MNKIRILAPTDFSACARNALDYAIGLSADLNGEIFLMHSIVFNDSLLQDSDSKEKDNTDRYNKSKIKIDKEVEYVKSKNLNIPITAILDGGQPTLSIASAIQNENINFIVMGTKGSANIASNIFGSFTSHILEIATCPVFTIPLAGKFYGIKNIVCTTEMDPLEKDAIKKSLELTNKLKAHITFLNVNSNAGEQKIMLEKFKREINGHSDHIAIDYEAINSDEILNTIDNYICKTNPELVITLGKEKSFFEKLFGKKVSKKLCLHTSTPLLSYPEYH